MIRDTDGTDWEDLRGSPLVVDPQSGSETLLADDVTTIALYTLNGRVADPEDLRRTLAVDAPYEDFLFARWTDDDRDDINGVWWSAP